MAQAKTRPPDDAFIELVGDGYAPPAYVWPVAFTRKPLDFWGDENLALCAEALRKSAFDSTYHRTPVLAKLDALDHGEQITGEQLQLQVPYSMTLLEALIDFSHRVLLDDDDLTNLMGRWAAEGVAKGEPLVLAPHFADELARFTEAVHLGLFHLDLRIGFDPRVGRWNPESLPEVYAATIALLEGEVHERAGEFREFV